VPGTTLVFFDEIQACPNAIKSLKYFHQKLKPLHVICAGSLLELSLGEYSFPVGCVEFKWMYPFRFREFLLGDGNEILADHIKDCQKKVPLLPAVHEKIMENLRLFFAIGGMPEAVERYIQTKSMPEVSRVHHDLMQSYVSDLHKYKGKMNIDGIEMLLERLPAQVGRRIKYRNLEPDWRIEKTKRLLDLLERILLAHRVMCTKANRLPLGARVSEKVFKCIFLDIGLMQYQCGIRAGDILREKDLLNLYRGALAEQFAGQELLASGGSENGKLYYWSREQKSSSAEIDYLKVIEGNIHPIEVKSGKPGKLKSMQIFLREHKHEAHGIILSSANAACNKQHNLAYLPLYCIP
ncbi:ATP-binding protein, partial [Fibrobacterota bacterium]